MGLLYGCLGRRNNMTVMYFTSSYSSYLFICSFIHLFIYLTFVEQFIVREFVAEEDQVGA